MVFTEFSDAFLLNKNNNGVIIPFNKNVVIIIAPINLMSILFTNFKESDTNKNNCN